VKDFFKYLKSRKLLDDLAIFVTLLIYTVGMLVISATETNEKFAEIDKDLQDWKALEQEQIDEMKELNYRRQLRLERMISEHEIKLRDLEQAHEERLAEIEEERKRRVEEYKEKHKENPGEIADEIEETFGFTFIE
jgi:DNA anti-recombination protein RmuC